MVKKKMGKALKGDWYAKEESGGVVAKIAKMVRVDIF